MACAPAERNLRMGALRDAIDAALDNHENAQLAGAVPLLARVAGEAGFAGRGAE